VVAVSFSYFLRTAANSVRKARGEKEYSVLEFNQLVKEKAKLLQLDDKMLSRAVNEGFSGGEKKRSEILQLAILNPKLAILDETDSGLDIDALQIVSQGVNAMRSPERSFLVITHYQRLLNYIVPDYVHIMLDGKIVKSGGKELALELEEKGYGWLKDEGALAVHGA
jgi:Fe-S cluster assembly ATP-binding protein